jgi:hypothetical protein
VSADRRALAARRNACTVALSPAGVRSDEVDSIRHAMSDVVAVVCVAGSVAPWCPVAV